ncbi:MAG: primosomal protein N' [Peptostreptococcales bacterium]
MKYINVIINNNSNQTDLLYTYKCREDSVCPGDSIIIKFGRGNKRIQGYVFEVLKEKPDYIEEDRIKFIEEILGNDIELTVENIEICKWMKEKYFCRYIDAIKCFIPRGSSLESSRTIKIIQKPAMESMTVTDKKIFELLEKNPKITIKQMEKLLGPGLDTRLKHLKDNHLIAIEEVLSRSMHTKYEQYIKIKDEAAIKNYIESKKNAPVQIEALEEILHKKNLSWTELRQKSNMTLATLKKFQSQGFVDIEMKETGKLAHQDIDSEVSKVISPTEEQSYALKKIIPYLEKDEHRCFLIHGVTGSGKTEIYLRLIEKTMALGKTAIVLVPEISLTLQMIERFKGRFGEENIALLHSRLTTRERYDEWLRIKRKKAQIVIGARSSVFAPLDNIGIIIVDEEHEASYKSDSTPRYNAIEIAEKRARLNDAVLVLGSATPLVSSYYKSERGLYERIELTKRYNENLMPRIDIVDMREELLVGNKNIFSRKLESAMRDNLEKGKQVILFINKRGYASFVSCRNCGYVMRCPECGISLTYHNHRKRVLCHYCGFQAPVPSTCPECSSQYIKYFGIGTERVEELTREKFSQYTCARLDLDTAKLKGHAQKTLKDYKRGKIQILIGTQMIAKGLDFPNVGLVGILAADISLNIADYRASERTFQLIMQASGRAGRGEERGFVVLQTYNPEHYSITTACQNDYRTFYRHEMIIREHLLYPPFSDIIQFIITGKDENDTMDLSIRIKKYLIKQLKLDSINRVLGPRIAPRQKIDKQYRFQILIKCNAVDQSAYHSIINIIQKSFLKKELKDFRLSIDVNPYSFM